jgi:hypothetical protein
MQASMQDDVYLAKEDIVWLGNNGRRHLNVHVGHWEHVGFSEEARFHLYRQDGCIKVHRQTGEALRKDCILPGSLGSWWWGYHLGAFLQQSKKLCIEQTHEPAPVHSHSGNNMLPFARRNFEAIFSFQDDNATAHIA